MRRSTIFLMLILLLIDACAPVRSASGFSVIVHPDGPLYINDQVSFELLAGTGETDGLSIQVSEGERNLGTAGFGAYGVGERKEAILLWAWDTSDLDPGRYSLTFSTLPHGPTWTETYTLHSAADVPPPEPAAHWTSTTSECCTLYYITGTDAERDIEVLKQVADEQAVNVEHTFGRTFPEPVMITLMPRTLGHGGFTSDGIYMSYLDNNYAGSTTTQIIHHELAHLLDAQIGGYRPAVLVEGMAVFISGGHFKQELLLPRAAGLFEPGWYIPLAELSDDFYPQQHEVGYLEAGALVQYMVEEYGWSAFNDFYRHLPDPGNLKPSQVMDVALQEKFDITLVELETDFITCLQNQPLTNAIRDDLRLTVRYYDTVRRYQQELDPSAHFMTAWQPDGAGMRQKGIVADLLRHPDGWKNRQIESLLMRADEELRLGNYIQAEKMLNWINWLMDLIIP